MAATAFTADDWKKIRRELNKNPQRYGLPRREYGSVLVGSFNIRKLGKLQVSGSSSGRDEPTMRFLADVCRHFDLVAVQEVLPDTTGVYHLQELMGPEFGILVSDIIGTFPGESGNQERLAYIYNRSIVQRGALVGEVSTSRSKVIRTIAEHHQELFDLMENSAGAKRWRTYLTETLPKWREERAEGSTKKEPQPPSFKVSPDPFLQFIRSPFAASFKVQGHPGLESYEFLAVNAHLFFGRKKDRRAEAVALAEWILGKVKSGQAINTVLMGDLNFDYDKPALDFKRILKRFDEMGGFSDTNKVYVSYPFLFPHPRPAEEYHPAGEIFRTNIIENQTYDQIGIFSSDQRMGHRLETGPNGHAENEQWGQPGGPDYGVFKYSQLFSHALNGRALDELTKADRTKFINRFQHRVSDHLPIWLRMPLPPSSKGFPTQV